MVHYSFDISSLEYFLLILVRITAFVVVAPFFGISLAPGRVKVGFSAIVSILLYQIITPKNPLLYSGVFSFAFLIIKETLVGLLIGFAGYICNTIILSAGKMIDMNIGLSMASEYDPMTQSESSVVSSMYNYFIMLLLIVSNMHLYILRAFVDSYKLFPVGEVQFDLNHLLSGMIKFMTDTFVIAFRIFLPVFAVTMIANVILGILAKVAPQLNMFSVGMQIKLFVGLVVMFITIFLLPDIANFIFKEMKTMISYFYGGLFT